MGNIKRYQKKIEDILYKLKIRPIISYIQSYYRKLKEHINRMNTGGIPNKFYDMSQKDKDQFGCPTKRWEEIMRL
jgi:hypothetical protein